MVVNLLQGRSLGRRGSVHFVLLLPVATALADIPALALTDTEAAGLEHGQAISLVALMGRIPRSADPSGGLARAMAGDRVVGLCRLEDGLLRPERIL